jgi:hypothetical protein
MGLRVKPAMTGLLRQAPLVQQNYQAKHQSRQMIKD